MGGDMKQNFCITRKQFVGGLTAAFGGLILPADAFGVGTPILKLGVVSDVHLGGEGKVADLERVLRFFDAEGVDAVMVPGDIAHTGLIKEFERFAAVWDKVFPGDCGADGRKIEKLFVTGNHCIDGWAGRWNGWSEERLRAERFNYADNPQKTWQRLFREDWHDIFVKTVKGIPFIGAQWKSEQAPFVKPPIAETIAKFAPTFDPKLPFFFFQHDPPSGTCFGPRGDAEVSAALKPWSNAVSISGHVHRSIADDRNAWQGSFTAISAGCMHEASGGLDYRNVNYYWHKPSQTKPMRTTEWIPRGGCCSVIEVFDDHLVMHRRSVQMEEALGEDWAIPLPAAYGKGFDFAVREQTVEAPQFAKSGKVSVSFCPKGHPEQAKRYAGQACVAVDFPAAQTSHGVVNAYEIAACLKDGPEIVRTKVIPNGFGYNKARMTIPGVCLFKTRELAGTRPVVFSVTPRECFGKAGRAIVSDPFTFDESAALKDSRKLVWSDEFDGHELDPKKWRFRKTMDSSDCLYTNDARTYEVKDSKLCLHVRPSPDTTKRCLLSRGVATHETMAFKYGYLEMRAKVPFKHGAWPSFWMTVPKQHQKASWMSEVDIFEVFSSKNEVVANLHKWGWDNAAKKSAHVMLPGGEGVSQESRGYRFPDPEQLNGDFHVYGFEWTPQAMSFYVDGMRFCTIPIDEAHDYAPKPLKGMAGHHDFHSVIFNNEVFTPGHGWMPKGAELKPEDLPIDYEIDWIRLYQRDGEEIVVP